MTDPNDYVSSAALDIGVCQGVCLAIAPLLAALDRLAGALRNKGRELEIIFEAARARPRDAASMTPGRDFEAFAAMVSEDRVALQHLQQRFLSAHPEMFVELCRTLTRTAMTVSTICDELRLLAMGPQPGRAEIILPARQAGIVEHDLLAFADHDVMMRDLLESLWWMTGAIVTLRVNCIEGIAANAARVDAFLSSDRLTRQ